jgi:ribonuclease P protein component
MDRRHRLRRDADIRRVRQRGRCWSSDSMVVCLLRAPTDQVRFAFIVGRRMGKAVVRNRVKRRLRETARALAPGLVPGYDIVVIARGPIVNRASRDLMETFAGLLRRAGALPAPAESHHTRPAAPPSAGPTASPDDQRGREPAG